MEEHKHILHASWEPSSAQTMRRYLTMATWCSLGTWTFPGIGNDIHAGAQAELQANMDIQRIQMIHATDPEDLVRHFNWLRPRHLRWGPERRGTPKWR